MRRRIVSLTPACTRAFSASTKSLSRSPRTRATCSSSERHAEALAHLLYGINEAGGFIQLTGEVGTGKTTVVRCLLEQLPDARRRRADPQPAHHARRVPAHHLRRAAHPGAASPAAAASRTSSTCSAATCSRRTREARRIVLMVDEAQNLARADARAGAAAHQPRDRDAEAAADHPDRPAGAARRCSAGRSCASSRSASPAAITSTRCPRDETAAYVQHRLRVAGATARGVHARRAARGSPALGRRAAPHQRHLRSRAARRVHARGPSRERHARAARPRPQVYGRPMPAPWLRWAIDRLDRGSAGARGCGLWSLLASRDRRPRPTANGRRRRSSASAVEPDRVGRRRRERTAASAAVLRRGARADTATTRPPRRRSASCSRPGARPTIRAAAAAATRPRTRVSNACSRRARGPSFAR